jgi:NAD(P)-dependent dehydrogenase (short-subunit alcohol dehydrogenase family)
LLTSELAYTRALVTGGGSGIGRASALALAALGSVVTVADINAAGGKQTAAEIMSAGGVGQFVECDVTCEEAVRAAVSAAASETGRLEFAVNCAGYFGPGPAILLADLETELFEKLIAVNLRGIYFSMKYELRQMLIHGSGAVVNISSGAGLVGLYGAAGYAGTKHGVIGLTKSAALDYASKGIRVNAICPGSIDTAMNATGRTPESREATRHAHPLGRIGHASEIADAVVWLCSGRSSFVTGVALAVDGGYVAR